MATKASPQLIVVDSIPQQLGSFPESDFLPGSNNALTTYGQTITAVTSAPLHFGGDASVRNADGSGGQYRGALFPAGVWNFDVSSNSQIWVIAPSGQSVTVEVLQVGV